jgi:hypothetical protein
MWLDSFPHGEELLMGMFFEGVEERVLETRN